MRQLLLTTISTAEEQSKFSTAQSSKDCKIVQQHILPLLWLEARLCSYLSISLLQSIFKAPKTDARQDGLLP